MKLSKGNPDGGPEFWPCQQSPLLDVRPVLARSVCPQKKSKALCQQSTHLLGGLEEALRFVFPFEDT